METLAYGPVLAIDAQGETLALTPTLKNKQFEIRVPDAWLRRAEFPVVIDPVIGPATLVTTLQGDARWPASASDGTNFLTAWSWNSDLYAQLSDGNGDPVGAMFPVTQAPHSQSGVEVLYNPVADEYLVAWWDKRYGSGEYALFARRVSTNSLLLGAEMQVSDLQPNLGLHGGIEGAVSEAGQVLLVWSHLGSSYDVFGQMLDSSGQLSGGVITMTTAGQAQRRPEVAYDDQSDTFLVVWEDYQGGNEYDLYGQRLNASGGLLGGHQLLVDASGQDLQDPALAANDAGQFMLVWYKEETSSDYDIYGLPITATSGATGSVIDFGTGGSKDHSPAITAVSTTTYQVAWTENAHELHVRQVGSDGSLLGSGSVEIGEGHEVGLAFDGSQSLVVWEDQETAGQKLVVARRLTGAGVANGSQLSLSPHYTLREPLESAYHAQSNHYLLTWPQAHAAEEEDIFIQKLDTQGQPLGGSLNLTNLPASEQHQPALAVGSSDYLLVWEDRRTFAASEVDVYAQRVASDGSLSGGVISVTTESDYQNDPTVAYNSHSGAYLVAWHDYRHDAVSEADITYQRVQPDGSLAWSSPQYLNVAKDQKHVAAAYNPDEQTTLLVFEDKRPGTSSSDLYGQVISADGSLMGSDFVVAAATGNQYYPAVAYSPAEQVYLAVWQDRRSGSYDIYGQVISGSGSLVGSNFALSTASNSQERPAVAARSGGSSAEFAVVWHDRRTSYFRNIYLQRVDGGGNLLDEPETTAVETDPTLNFLIQGDNSRYFARPDISYNSGEGVYLIAWTDQADGGVYTRRYSPTTPPAPTAGFTATPTSGSTPLSVTFTHTSTGQLESATWDFGDGSPLLADLTQVVTHTYTQSGTYTAVLTVSNQSGSDSAARLITVTQPTSGTLSVDFSASPTTGTAPLTVTFTSLVTPTGSYSHTWDFGDGNTAAVISPTHTYTQAGVYTVSLSVDSGTQSQVLTQTHYITVTQPTSGTLSVDFSASPLSGTAPLTVTFTSLVTPTGSYSHTWDFGDGNTAAVISPTHTYTQAGVYTVSLQVSNAGGSETLTRTDYLSVYEPVVADFTASPLSGTAPLTVTFTSQVTPTGSYSHTWDFGDGNTAAVISPTHTYTQAGVYTVSLTVDSGSQSEVLTRANYIIVSQSQLAPPVPDFSADPLTGIVPLTVNFTNLSTDANSFLWDFGDGITTTVVSPTHTYTQSGLYNISLTATGPGGSRSQAQPNYIQVVPSTPPSVTILSPTQNLVVGPGNITVSGLVTDDGQIDHVLVNEVLATLNGNTFSAAIPLAGGNQVINVVAEDNIGLMGFDSTIVRVDDEGPQVTIAEPANRQSVYTRTPTVTVNFSDFAGSVNLASLAAQLSDEQGTVTDVTSNLSVNATSAVGQLSPPLSENTSYTLTISLADDAGNLSQSRSTFYVPPNTTSITPPPIPPEPGWATGVVYDSSTCDQYLTTCQGLPGVEITFSYTGSLTNTLSGTIISGPDGFFAFPFADTGYYWLRGEKGGYTYAQRQFAIVKNRSQAANAIYLTPLDGALTPCDDQGCSHTSADGQMTVEIPAGAIATGEQVDVTATEFDRVFFLPSGALPPGTAETYAFNLGGASDYEFQQPFTVTLKNSRGFDPGTEIPLGFWNQHTMQWEHEGVAVVDSTGEWLVMQMTHFSNHDPNFPIQPSTLQATATGQTDEASGSSCGDGEEGCFINYSTGSVEEWIDLPPVTVLGRSVAPQLRYNTLRANPSAVIDVQVDLNTVGNISASQVGWELYIEGQKTDNFTLAADTTQPGELGRYRYLWNGRNGLGDPLPPGVYNYAVKLSFPVTAEYCRTDAVLIFGGQPDCVNGATGVFINTTETVWASGQVTLNSQPQSHLGQGWLLNDRQQIYESENGLLLVSDGRRHDRFYFGGKDILQQSGPATPGTLAWVSRGQGTTGSLHFGPEDVLAQTQETTITVSAPSAIVRSADGSRAYVTQQSGNNSLAEVDLVTNQVVITIPVGQGPTALALSPDESRAYVVNATDRTVSVVDLSAQTLIQTILISDANANLWDAAIAVTPDGSKAYLTQFDYGSLAVLDLITGVHSETIPLTDSGPVDLALSPDGTTAYIAHNNQADDISVVDLATRQVSTLPIPDGTNPFRMLISPDGQSLYLAGGSQALTVAVSSGQVGTIALGSAVYDLALSANGVFAYALHYNSLTVFNPTTLQILGSFDTPTDPFYFVVSPDGRMAHITYNGNDTLTNLPLLPYQLPLGNNPQDLVLSPDDQYAYVVNQNDNTLSLIDLGTYPTITETTVSVGSSPVDVAVTADQTTAYVANYGAAASDHVSLVNLTLNPPAQTGTLDLSGRNPTSLALSVDDSRLYVGMEDLLDSSKGILSIIDLSSTSTLFDVTLNEPVQTLALSPDGQALYLTHLNDSTTISVVDLTAQPQPAVRTLPFTPSLSGLVADIALATNGLGYILQEDFGGSDLLVMDLASEQITATIPLSCAGNRLTLSGDEGLAYITAKPASGFGAVPKFSGLASPLFQLQCPDPDVVLVVDLVAQQEINQLAGGTDPAGITVSRQKSSAAIAPLSLTEIDYTQLSYDAGSDTYQRHYRDGRSVQFDAQGRHLTTQEPGGLQWSYSYNPDGSIDSMGIIAPGQTTPAWVWDFSYTNGQLSTISDPIGRQTSFTVDSHNHLTEVAFPDGSRRQFTYDSRGLLTQQIDAEDAVTSYVYDAYGRLSQHIDPQRVAYDPLSDQSQPTAQEKTFTPSDTGYQLLNESAVGDPANPAPAVAKSAEIMDGVAYESGGLSGQTNRYGNFIQRTDALSRTTALNRDSANRITQLIFPDGSCLEAAYDAQGNAVQAVRMPQTQCDLAPENRDPAQLQTSAKLHETRFNKPKVITDTNGRVTTYTYDYEVGQGEAGRVVRIDYPAVTDETGTLVVPSVSYSYNSLGLLETETDQRGTTTRYLYTQGTPDEADGGSNPLFAPSVNPVPGLLTQLIEDDDDLQLTTTYRDFDALGNAQTIIYPGGNRTAGFSFDTLGRLTQETSVEGVVTDYQHNDRGQVTRRVVDPGGENIVMVFDYDGEGHLTYEATTADGLTVERHSDYDANGRLVRERDGQGNETRYIYDDAGQLVETIDPDDESTYFTYTALGQPDTTTDPDNHVTRTIYDEFGRPQQVIRAEGELDLTTIYTYTLEGLVDSTQAPDGTVTCFTYDDLKRRVKTVQDCGPGGLNLTTRYVYDLLGNTVLITDTRGIVTYNEYDALGRLQLTVQDVYGLALSTWTDYDPDTGQIDSVTGPDGTVTEYHYNPTTGQLTQVCQDALGLNLCTSTTYDALGRQETVTDPEGVVQRTIYNGHGLPVQEIADDGGLAATTVMSYNNLLQLVEVIDPNGNPTTYYYNARGQLETEVYADGTWRDFDYDPRGNLETQYLPDDTWLTTTYDAANRRERVDFSSGGFQTFRYDPAGRLTAATQTVSGHTTETGYGYNPLGEVITTSQQLDGGSTWLTGYAYDYATGQRTVTYPSGAVRVTHFDALNRIDRVEDGSSTLIADYTFDVINRVNTLAYPNGLTNRSDYDPLGRITQVRVNDGTSDIVDYTYGYDGVGNRTHMQRNHRPGLPSEVYQYDDLTQLVQVWYGADATTPTAISSYTRHQDYTLDKLGNRLTLTEDDGTTSSTEAYGPHDGSQLLNPMNRYETVQSQPLTYDPRGNTLSDGEQVYTYDILNRQTGVSNTGGSAEYIYDARGRRVAKVVNGVTTHFIYDINYRVIEERDGSESLLARYTYGLGMDEPLTMERGGQTYTYHRDALGSITEVSDSGGSIIERYEYDVYGEVSIFDGSDNPLSASAIGNPYLFTARRFDPESGNYYYRARIYSPALGRFLSVDPLGFDAGDTNLYRYAFNNPTTLTDPTGEFAIVPWLLKASAEAAVDALAQVVIYRYFDPSVTTLQEAVNKVDYWQVGAAFVTGLLPGGRVVQSLAGAGTDVFLTWQDAQRDACEEYPFEQMVQDFAQSFAIEMIGSYIGDFAAKYGVQAIEQGLKQLGVDEATIKKLTKALDDCPTNSFTAGTVVHTDQGLVLIEAVEIGDRVYALDPETGESGYFEVVALHNHLTGELLNITVESEGGDSVFPMEVMSITPAHPVYVEGRGWVDAAEVAVGDRLRRQDGGWARVLAVERVVLEAPQMVYNLTVAGIHTYFVLEVGVLVHNCGGKTPAGYTPEQWKKRKEVVDAFDPGECHQCASTMNTLFKDRLIVLTSGARHWPLRGPQGEDITAPIGWHIVSLDSKGNVWDNFGFRGSKDEFLDAMKVQNPAMSTFGPFDTILEANQAIDAFDPQ